MTDKKTLKLLVATGNAGKIREFKQLLADLPIQLIGLTDVPGITQVDETGATFEENAVLKAQGYALQTGMWAMADDSGLEVDALNCRPGVYSARYGGDETSFGQKMDLLLSELADTGSNDRSARFISVIAVADDMGEIRHIAQGVVEGELTASPRGRNGFGYDPIFVPEGYSETFGELTSDVKQHISHRARASAKIIRFFRDFIGV